MAYDIAAVLGLGIFASIFAYLSMNLSKKHGSLQILFMFLSVFLIYLSIGSIAEVGTIIGFVSVTNIAVIELKIITWIMYFLVAYFLVYFIYHTFMKTAGKKEKGFGEE